MKVLFIGGTGVISSACSALAVQRGIDLTLLNRGSTTSRPAPDGAHILHGDIRDPASVRSVLDPYSFDVVVDWVAFTPQHVQTDLDLFRGRTGQYVFISSASVYQTPPAHLPVTESTPLDNPYWEYSRNKIACEDLLVRAYRDEKFPMTVVRPSHTYDRTLLPFHGHFTVIDRMRRGKGIVVPGDGSSLWVLTHNTDFARGFIGLLGHTGAIGEAFHITSDEWLTWNQIYETLAHAAGVKPHLVHIPSELINAFDPDLGAGLLGDKSNSMIFDNSKIRRLVPDFRAVVPFARGAEEIIAWFDADPARKRLDEHTDRLMDKLIERYTSIWP